MSCPDGFYRGCDFMGCEGLLRDCPTWPACPHKPELEADDEEFWLDLHFPDRADCTYCYGDGCLACEDGAP